jgi:hypothetical protein
MELDEMRALWGEQRQTLERNTKLQAEVLKQLARQRLGSLFGAIIRWEYINLLTCMVLLILLLLHGRRDFDLYLDLCYFFALAYLFYGVLTGVYKLRVLHKMDGTGPVLATVAGIEKMRLWLTRMRLPDIVLFPLVVLAIYAIVNQLVHGVSVFRQWQHYYPRVLLAMLLSVLAAVGVYRGFYLKKLREAQAMLEDMKQWEK